MQISVDAMVFDMDGVLLQSNQIKHHAMLDLFEMDEAQRRAVERYNLGAGGVPRREKFAHIWANLLGRPYGPEVEARLAANYERMLGEHLMNAPLVEGVATFVEESGCPCYVCTAAPVDEAREVLTHRKLILLFRAIFGAPTSKADALRAIARIDGTSTDRVLFFGDSRADLDAARAVGCRFVGVTREKNDFSGGDVPTIRDFEDRTRLEPALQAARPQR